MNVQLKTPPNSAEAEAVVIGAIAEFPGAFDRVASLLEPRDFYRGANQMLFEYAKALDSQGEAVDALTLSEWANREGKPELIDALLDAVGSVSSASNLERYAKVIRERRLERDLIAASSEIGDIGYENLPTLEKLNRAQALVMGLTLEQRTTTTRLMPDVLKSVMDEMQRRLESDGSIQGLATGLLDVDKRWGGLKPGDLVVLAGRPAMGKSTLAMNIAEHNVLAGKRALVFSLEMSAEQLVERSMASRSGLLHDEIKTGRILTNRDGSAKLSETVAKFRTADLLIDDTAGIDLPRIRARVRQASVEKPLDLIIVDHLQLMSGDGFNRNDAISEITRGLKGLAKEAGCPLILLSQLNREVDKRPYPKNRPIMSDLRDSGSIEQDADIVAFVYRNVVYKEHCAYPHVAELCTVKFRNGVPGTTYLLEDFAHCRFQNYAGDAPNYDEGSVRSVGFDPSEFGSARRF